MTALVAVPAYTLAPGYPWIGIAIVCGTDLLVKFAISRPEVPSEALAACLVTGICATLLWVILVLGRYAVRFVAAVFAVVASAIR